ncbi:peptidase S8/S53 domain-containing protein [Choanephora cucurbitarum]|nr:peptidase S8/S53 domain-containing protein [Choanephora cucurbitarum]
MLSHRWTYLSSITNNQTSLQRNSDFSAASVNNELKINHIDIGSEFVAITGVFSDNDFVNYLNGQSEIDYIEENYKYSVKTFPSLQEQQKAATDEINMASNNQDIRKRQLIVESSPNWGLARISQRQMTNMNEYTYDEMGGSGVTVFVLDSGVFVDHSDFEGRASHSINTILYEDENDSGGHGTHVASKIIGKKYGVAKGAKVRSVKILNRDGDGSTSSLLKGVEHVAQNAIPGKSLINLSLSGKRSKLVDDALNNLVLQYNVPVFVSAGNDGTDACLFSPSSNPNVFSVGAADEHDTVPKFSNIGACVEMYAPGRNIESAYIGNQYSSRAMDGTSMASPHVAGIAANLMGRHNFSSAQEVYDTLMSIATADILHFDNSRTSSPNYNLLAYSQL